MKNVYLVFAIAGAAIPYYFFLQHVGVAGVDPGGFLGLAFANPVAAGFSADLFISSFAFWAFMFAAGSASPRPWPFIGLNLLIGLSCALPAYLYWRERQSVAH